MATMSSPASLLRANELLRELRQAIRKVEVVTATRPSSSSRVAAETPGRTTDAEHDIGGIVWTLSVIEAFNNSSIRTVAAARDALADARYEAEQRRGDADGETLIGKVVQSERDLEHLRTELRRSVAARKRHEERNYDAHSRIELLGAEDADGTRRGHRADLPVGRGGNTAGGGAAGDAREMKLSLERTRKMMAEQLERVAQVSEVMGEQDALLRDTFQQHQGIGGTVRRARTTLTRLKAADVMDTVFMVASTLFFFATVCFVVYQRLPLLGLL